MESTQLDRLALDVMQYMNPHTEREGKGWGEERCSHQIKHCTVIAIALAEAVLYEGVLFSQTP